MEDMEYGLFMQCGFIYHGTNEEYFEYVEQFEYEDDHLFTMELDLAQKRMNGILSVDGQMIL